MQIKIVTLQVLNSEICHLISISRTTASNASASKFPRDVTDTFTAIIPINYSVTLESGHMKQLQHVDCADVQQ